MAKVKQIPTLEIVNLDRFHFGKVQWRFSKQHHLFHINRLEDARGKLSFPLPPHRKTVYDLLFLTKGETIRSKGLNQYTLGPNQFFFLPALQITSHESMSEEVKGFFLHFSPDLFSNSLHLLKAFSFLQFNTLPVVTIPENEVSPILNIFERLMSLYERQSQEGPELVVWYLMALFTEVNRYAQFQESKKRNAPAILTQQFKDLLTQHIYTHRTVGEYAKLLHVTPNHLNKSIKKTLDKTAQTLLNEMLILEAQSLLKYSDLTISQIANQLCKSTPSNFSRFFKNQTGISPSDFIQQ